MNEEDNEKDIRAYLTSIDGLKQFLDNIDQNSYGGVKFNCPMKPKDKAYVILIIFYVFYGIIILFNAARKCCPNRIE